MNSTNKKTAGARIMPQPANRHAGHVPPSQSVVAHPKTRIAPPVYKPQPLQTGVQAKLAGALPKTAVTTPNGNRPAAPPVYRPQAAPKVLQRKKDMSPQTRQIQRVVQMVWHRVHGKKGRFEGDENYHHIHSVGGKE